MVKRFRTVVSSEARSGYGFPGTTDPSTVLETLSMLIWVMAISVFIHENPCSYALIQYTIHQRIIHQ